jgi:hypothetical protein
LYNAGTKKVKIAEYKEDQKRIGHEVIVQAIPNHREPLDNDHDTTKTPTPRGMPQ